MNPAGPCPAHAAAGTTPTGSPDGRSPPPDARRAAAAGRDRRSAVANRPADGGRL